jgi:hypothetical protein
MRCAGLGCGETTPFRIEPQGVKVGKYSVESSGNKQWAVFDEDKLRPDLSDDSGHFGPKP